MKVYITYKKQVWTDGEKGELYNSLSGTDDKILTFKVNDENFIIILKNGYTYGVADSEMEAKNFIEGLYSAYKVYENEDSDYCYYPINNPDIAYETASDAEEDGYNETVYIPYGYKFLTKNKRIIADSYSEEELWQKMYKDYGDVFTCKLSLQKK